MGEEGEELKNKQNQQNNSHKKKKKKFKLSFILSVILPNLGEVFIPKCMTFSTQWNTLWRNRKKYHIYK